MISTLHNMFSKTQITGLIFSGGAFTISELTLFSSYVDFAIKIITLITALVILYQVITKDRKRKMNEHYKSPDPDDEDGTSGEDGLPDDNG